MKQYVHDLSLGAAEVGPPSREFLAWIAARDVPPAATGFLAHTWVKDDQAFVGAITLMSESAIQRHADEEPRWLQSGFLVFRSCMNGDMVALDARASPGSVWFLSHDELWGDDIVEGVVRRANENVAIGTRVLLWIAAPEFTMTRGGRAFVTVDTVTDARGRYRFVGIPPGNVTVTAWPSSKAGGPGPAPFVVEAGQRVVHDLVLPQR